ncbi:MAG: ABC transporter ATP-binding protein [Ornithinimicrobium sp.]|uniref:ABC transporter ATP-binding protein n=1 Tax=Ornithinimicrobium sp. TaxID=1977084 RepID=UPI0026DF85A7|nr:ABC transporter ATP-binding protein [Ornithinimicrobium sp.]MDO5739436.1 ABC transporter ATP-binding protein [Ornithinimicrobium sp.]
MTELVLEKVSRWYGNVVAVNDVTMTIGPGVTGLLGPNGAGKSTLISMMAGFLAPSSGEVRLGEERVWRNVSTYQHLGLVPEREVSFSYLTGRQFVQASAELHKLRDSRGATQRALEEVDLVDPADRPISTYSKGMRQRAKLASALVHEPEVLLLDEPFNGVDPRQRMHLMALLTRMGEQGRTVLFSSHILEEVEQIARHIEVVVSGRHAASGDFGAIRALMTDRPSHYTIRSTDDRALAAALMGQDSVRGVTLGSVGAGEAIMVEVTEMGQFTRALPQLARQAGITVRELAPTDESLESVFTYLVQS